MEQGKFIVFEGLDGSGTSTQAALLADALRRQGRRCHVTSEPSPGPIGVLIRQAFSGRLKLAQGRKEFDQQMAYLFAADRHDHLHNNTDGILQLVNDGAVVISTRYFFSSFAYHCHDDDDWTLVSELNSRFPPPDLVVYLENPVAESVRRLAARTTQDIYENEAKLEYVSRNYARVFSTYTGNLLKLNATDRVDTIHRVVVQAVGGIL